MAAGTLGWLIFTAVLGQAAAEGHLAARPTLVLLESQPNCLDETRVRAAAACGGVKAFTVAVKGAEWLVRRPDGLFVVRSGRDRYALPAVAGDAATKAAVRRHTCWLAVERREGSEDIARVAAALAGAGTLAMHDPSAGTTKVWDPTANRPVPPEARRRWAEFAAAWGKRQPGQAFAVKAPFLDGDKQETMWMLLDRIEGERLIGRLDAPPAQLAKLRRGDRVETEIGQIVDWMHVGSDGLVGGFTVVKPTPRVPVKAPRVAPAP